MANGANWFNQAMGNSVAAQTPAPSLQNSLVNNQLNGIGTANNLGQSVMGQAAATNAGNQGAAVNQYDALANVANSQVNQGGAFARALLYEPVLAQMAGGLSGSGAGSGMTGFQSTNSPQSAYLPGGAPSAAGAPAAAAKPNPGLTNSYNWSSPLQQMQAQAQNGGANALGFLGYNAGGSSTAPGFVPGMGPQQVTPQSSQTLAQQMSGAAYKAPSYIQ